MIQTVKEWIFGKAPVLWFPDERTYEIVACKEMPSAIGMRIVGRPTPKDKVVVSKGKEFRTFQPLQVTDTPEGFVLRTSKIEVVFEEVKIK